MSDRFLALDPTGTRCDIQVMHRLVPVWFAIGITLVGGCSQPDEASLAPASEGSTKARVAEPSLDALEHELVTAQRVEIEFRITSSGAVETDLSGTLAWTGDTEFHLDAQGSFAGVDQDLELRGDSEQLQVLVAGRELSEGPRPAALIEAVALSLTRQGLLHNLAMLSAGQSPERAEGGIDEWLGVREPTLGASEVLGQREGRPLDFGVVVDGRDVGRAELWFDAQGSPFERRQVVHFDEGDMEVVERYTRWLVE